MPINFDLEPITFSSHPQFNFLSGWRFRWMDANPKKLFMPSKKMGKDYERELLHIVSGIKSCLQDGDLKKSQLNIEKWKQSLNGWANQAARKMVLRVEKQNEDDWREVAGKEHGNKTAFLYAPNLAELVEERVAKNVRLIGGIGDKAMERIGKVLESNISAGSRSEDITAQIEKIVDMSKNEVRRIARTEVSKTSTALTTTRSKHIGSPGYIWRTAGDGNVRDEHAHMEGKFVEWDKPPTFGKITAHAGESPNCRCYPEPVIPQDFNTKDRYTPPMQLKKDPITGQQQTVSQWMRQNPLAVNHVIPHVPGGVLHNVDKSVFVDEKLTKYSLDLDHPGKGADKAKKFKEILGFEKEDWQTVKKQVMELLPYAEAVRNKCDKEGERFNVYIPVTGKNGRMADVMSAWIYRRNEKTGVVSEIPILTNCFIDGKGQIEKWEH